MYYGVPQRHGIPFSHKLDTLVVNGEGLDQFGRDEAMDGVAYQPNLLLQDWNDKNHWLLHDGVYSINESPAGVRLWSKIVRMSADFLQRVERIIMMVEDGTTYRREDWEYVWRMISKAFVNTKHVKLNVSCLDNCGAATPWERQTMNHYKIHDLRVLGGLGLAARNTSPGDLFQNLKRIEVEKVARFCSHSWRRRERQSPSIYLGTYLLEMRKHHTPNILQP